MSGFSDFLFGDQGGGVKSQDLRKLINELASTMRTNLGQSGPIYGGQLVPDMNANTQGALDAGNSLLSGINPNQTDAINRLLSGAGDIQGTNQFYQDSVLAPSNLAFRDALDSIDGRYGSQWGTSGAHDRAVADATARYGIGVNDALGQLVFQDRQNALDRQGIGVNASINASQDYQSRLMSMLGLGDYQRGIQGEQLGADFNQWQAAQPYNNPWLGFLGTSLGTAQQAAPQAGFLEKGKSIFSFVDPLLASRF